MDINKNTMKHIAKLARIRLTDEQAEHFREDLDRALGLASSLNEVNTQDVEATERVTPFSLRQRPDNVEQTNSVKDILQNAPEQQADMFVVPKVLE